MSVVVRRSAVKMWLLAIGGIPLLVIAIDVLTNRRITNWLREIVFRPEDTQIYEPRDVIYAWGLLLFSALLVVWGLKELFYPTKVVEARPKGLALRLRGPMRGPDLIPWSEVKDVAGGEMADEGEFVPMFLVEVTAREGLPDHPWGARWAEPHLLAVLAQDWGEDPAVVAGRIADYAVDMARHDPEQEPDAEGRE